MTVVIDQKTAEAWGEDVTVSPTQPLSAREVLFRVGPCGTFSPVARDVTTYECNSFHSLPLFSCEIHRVTWKTLD